MTNDKFDFKIKRDPEDKKVLSNPEKKVEPDVKPEDVVVPPIVPPIVPEVKPEVKPDITVKPEDVIKPADGEFKTDDLEAVTLADKDGEEIEVWLDKDGNAVDKEGTIVYSKDDLDDEVIDNDDKDKSVSGVDISNIIATTNISPVDETNKPKIYDNTPEGYALYANDAYEKGALDYSKANNQDSFLNALVSKYPVLDPVLAHLEKNNSLEGFNTSVDVNKELSKDNVSQQKAIALKDRLDKKDTVDQANEYIAYLEENNKLFDYAKDAKQGIQATQKQQKLEEAYNAQTQFVDKWGVDYQGEVANVDGSIYDIIMNKKELNLGETKVAIPEIVKIKKPDGSLVNAKREEFFEYLFVPKARNINGVIENITDYDLRMMEKNRSRTLNDDLYDALLTFTNNEPNQLVKDSIQKEEFKKVKRQFKVKHAAGSSKSTDATIKLKVKRNK
jgi:hypothetical protein